MTKKIRSCATATAGQKRRQRRRSKAGKRKAQEERGLFIPSPQPPQEVGGGGAEGVLFGPGGQTSIGQVGGSGAGAGTGSSSTSGAATTTPTTGSPPPTTVNPDEGNDDDTGADPGSGIASSDNPDEEDDQPTGETQRQQQLPFHLAPTLTPTTTPAALPPTPTAIAATTPTTIQPQQRPTTVVQQINTVMHIFHSVDNPQTVSIELDSTTTATATTTDTDTDTLITSIPSSSTPTISSSASASLLPITNSSDAPSTTSGAFHTVPLVLGIIVASVIGLAAIGATISWFVRLRRGHEPHDDEGMWAEDMFKGETFDASADEKGLDVYGGATPRPVTPRIGGIAPPHLGGDGPYFSPATPRMPPSAVLNHPADLGGAGFPNPHQHSPGQQPSLTPGPLTIANFTPGDISDSSLHAGAAGGGSPSLWLAETPSIPQRPWTASYTPYLSDGRQSTSPLSMGGDGSRAASPSPWAPLRIPTKSKSRDGSTWGGWFASTTSPSPSMSKDGVVLPSAPLDQRLSPAPTIARRKRPQRDLSRNVQTMEMGGQGSVSQYSCASSGYTTDKGEEGEEELKHCDILKGYAMPSRKNTRR